MRNKGCEAEQYDTDGSKTVHSLKTMVVQTRSTNNRTNSFNSFKYLMNQLTCHLDRSSQH